MDCIYCNKSAADSDFLFETTYWKFFLAIPQVYIGRVIVMLKRHTPSLTDLTNEELLDFMDGVKKYEHVCKKLFNATLFNWSILVNNSYRQKPYTPHAHWHGRPRYDHEVVFEGVKFEDSEFGEHYNNDKENAYQTDPEIFSKIVSIIKAEL